MSVRNDVLWHDETLGNNVRYSCSSSLYSCPQNHYPVTAALPSPRLSMICGIRNNSHINITVLLLQNKNKKQYLHIWCWENLSKVLYLECGNSYIRSTAAAEAAAWWKVSLGVNTNFASRLPGHSLRLFRNVDWIHGLTNYTIDGHNTKLNSCGEWPDSDWVGVPDFKVWSRT